MGAFSSAAGSKETWGSRSGLPVRNKWVSPALCLPLTYFGFKGILPLDIHPGVTACFFVFPSERRENPAHNDGIELVTLNSDSRVTRAQRIFCT